MVSKSLRNVRRTPKLRRDGLITLLDKQCRVIHDQDKITERIEEIYTELYYIEQGTIIHTDERKIPRGRPAKQWRDELDDYWKSTIWQRIAQGRQTWRQHAEAFAQPMDTMAAQ